ncbi:unnamed protein product [Gordionus sp. m RMFG-2023]
MKIVQLEHSLVKKQIMSQIGNKSVVFESLCLIIPKYTSLKDFPNKDKVLKHKLDGSFSTPKAHENVINLRKSYTKDRIKKRESLDQSIYTGQILSNQFKQCKINPKHNDETNLPPNLGYIYRNPSLPSSSISSNCRLVNNHYNDRSQSCSPPIKNHSIMKNINSKKRSIILASSYSPKAHRKLDDSQNGKITTKRVPQIRQNIQKSPPVLKEKYEPNEEVFIYDYNMDSLNNDKSGGMTKLESNLKHFAIEIHSQLQNKLATLLKIENDLDKEIPIRKPLVMISTPNENVDSDTESSNLNSANEIVNFLKRGIGYGMDSKDEKIRKFQKKKFTARLKKQIGDYCMLLGRIDDALIHYESAIEANKLIDDPLWTAGSLEGWCSACICKMSNLYSSSSPSSQSCNKSLSAENLNAYPKNLFIINDLTKPNLLLDKNTMDKGSTSSPNKSIHSSFKSKYLKSPFFNQSHLLSIGSSPFLAKSKSRIKLLPFSQLDYTKLPHQVSERFRHAIDLYDEIPEAASIRFETILKTIHYHAQINQNLTAALYIQEAIYLRLNIKDEDTVSKYLAISDLYGIIGMKRKEAFYKRVASLQTVSAIESNPLWIECNLLLTQVLSGYSIPLDLKELRSEKMHSGWPSIQHRIMNELIVCARRCDNFPLAARHAMFNLQFLYPYMTKKDIREDLELLKALVYKSKYLGTNSIVLENGLMLAPVPMVDFPVISQLSFPSYPPSLKPHLVKKHFLKNKSYNSKPIAIKINDQHRKLKPAEYEDDINYNPNTNIERNGFFTSPMFSTTSSSSSDSLTSVEDHGFYDDIVESIPKSLKKFRKKNVNPFIYSPFFENLKARRESADEHLRHLRQRVLSASSKFHDGTFDSDVNDGEIDAVWVKDEPAQLIFHISNPLPTDLPINYIGIISDKNTFREIRPKIVSSCKNKLQKPNDTRGSELFDTPEVLKAEDVSSYEKEIPPPLLILPPSGQNIYRLKRRRPTVTPYVIDNTTPKQTFFLSSGRALPSNETRNFDPSWDVSKPSTSTSEIGNTFAIYVVPHNSGKFVINGYYVELYDGLRNNIRDKDLKALSDPSRDYFFEKRKHLGTLSVPTRLHSFHYVVKVAPVLPLLRYSTTFPTVNYTPPPITISSQPNYAASYVIPKIFANIYTGEYIECPITITNLGEVSVEAIKLFLCKFRDRNLYNQLLTFNPKSLKSYILHWKPNALALDSAHSLIPINPNSSKVIFISIYGGNDFYKPNVPLVDGVNERKESTHNSPYAPSPSHITAKFSNLKPFKLKYTSTSPAQQSKETPQTTIHDSKIKIVYSGNSNENHGFGRELEICFHIEIKNAVIIKQCDILPSEKMDECYLVLDLTNVDLVNEICVQYTRDKKVDIEPRETTKIALAIKKINIDIVCKASFPPGYLNINDDLKNPNDNLLSKPLSSLLNYLNYLIDIQVEITWKIISFFFMQIYYRTISDTFSRIRLYTLDWTSEQLDALIQPQITWELTLVGNIEKNDEFCLVKVSQVVFVSVLVHNNSGKDYKDFHVSIKYYQNLQNGHLDYDMTDKVIFVGTLNQNINNITSKSTYRHNVSFIFQCAGIFFIKMICSEYYKSDSNNNENKTLKAPIPWSHCPILCFQVLPESYTEE